MLNPLAFQLYVPTHISCQLQPMLSSIKNNLKDVNNHIWHCIYKCCLAAHCDRNIALGRYKSTQLDAFIVEILHIKKKKKHNLTTPLIITQF